MRPRWRRCHPCPPTCQRSEAGRALAVSFFHQLYRVGPHLGRLPSCNRIPLLIYGQSAIEQFGDRYADAAQVTIEYAHTHDREGPINVFKK